MNRTFLILLMVGTAMLITVIGQHEPANRLDTMPWEVTKLDNGSIRVFGVTLEKTSIQDANQIFADFAQTQLQVAHFTLDDGSQGTSLKLTASYNELSFGGLNAYIQLSYQADSNELLEIYNTITADQKTNQPTSISGTQTFSISDKISIQYLNRPVSEIIYIPSVDYDLDAIQENFGVAAQKEQLSETVLVWHYPDMGLTIYIDKNAPDRFVYKSP